MIERLRTLARMQKFDDEIGRCRELQKILPQQLYALIEAVDSAQAKLLQTETVRSGIVKRQKELEVEIKHNQDLIRKYGNQLADIKTNKEYKALNSEIASLTQKNKEIEDMLLELMETESELKKETEKDKQELAVAEKAKSAKESDLRAQIAALDGNIEELRSQRNDLARGLPIPLIKQYSNLIKYKNNIAVAYNNNGACGGCGFVIRPQMRIELDLRRKIISCESCGRLLINRFDDI